MAQRKKIHPSVFIVVLNYNNYDDTEKCVSSLQKLDYPNYSIIIVDNNSTDGSGLRLKQRFTDIEFIYSNHNGGFAAGNNIGIKYALKEKAEYVLVLNNDTIADPNTLRAMVEVIEENNDTGIVTCKILYERTKKIYVSAGRISNVLCAVLPLKKQDESTICDVSYIAGCAMLIKKEVFDSLGLLDENFFMYYEDVEYSKRVSKKYRLKYTPFGTIYHKSGGGDSWKNYSPFYLYYSSRNRILAFSNGKMINKCYATVANMSNVILKSLYIIYYCIYSCDKNEFYKIKALFTGMHDGIKNIKGRRKGY